MTTKLKKGTTVWLVCRTHDAQSKEWDEYTLEEDMTEDELMEIAREYAESTKELEWWIEDKKPTDDGW